MKIETITGAILRKMSDIGKCQMKFLIHIVHLYLTQVTIVAPNIKRYCGCALF